MKKEAPEIKIRSRYAVALLLTGILLLALALRLLALSSLDKSPYFDILLFDEHFYHTWAAQIADGSYQSGDVYEFPPLPAYFMAGIYKLLSPNHINVRLAYILLGTLTCLFIYLTGKELTNSTVGLWSALAAALYEPFILYNIVPLKTTLSLFLFSVMVWLVLWSVNRYRWYKPIPAGICLGMLLNIRGNYMVLIPLMIVIMFFLRPFDRFGLKQAFGQTLLFVFGLVLAVLPFTLRNYFVAGEFCLTTSQAGLNLYLGNNLHNKLPYYRPVPFASSSPLRQGKDFTIEAGRRTGRNMSDSEASSFWTKQVLADGLEHHAYYSWKAILKTLALLNRFEAGDHYHIGFISQFARFFKFPFLTLWMILPFGLLGLLLNVTRARTHFFTALMFVFYASTLIIFFSTARYRLPLLVILIPYAVIGVKELAARVRQKSLKRLVPCLGLLVMIVIIEFLPLPGTDDMTAYYNTHALVLNLLGRQSEARQYWQRSSDMDKSYSAFANLSLARISYEKKRDLKKALTYLKRIDDQSFAASNKYLRVGDVMLLAGRIGPAVKAYQKALQINAGQTEARLKLIRIYDKLDKRKALKERKAFERIEGVKYR